MFQATCRRLGPVLRVRSYRDLGGQHRGGLQGAGRRMRLETPKLRATGKASPRWAYTDHSTNTHKHTDFSAVRSTMPVNGKPHIREAWLRPLDTWRLNNPAGSDCPLIGTDRRHVWKWGRNLLRLPCSVKHP